MARMRPHVESCASFNRHQSAYRRRHSTETTLLRVLDAADNHSQSLLLQLDLSAEFDNNNNNNNSHDNAYGAVIMTKVIARVHPVHLMNVD